jgi:DNA adenine methylase
LTAAPLRPPIPYFGGKMTLGHAIAGLLPAHDHYVEPYCGSLAVLLAKPPMGHNHETVNDLDGALMTFWRVLRDRPDDLARVCALTPHSRAEQQAAYEPTDDDLEMARRVWIQLSQGRAGTRRRTGFRHYVKTNSTTSMPDYLEAYVDRMAAVAERLHHVSLESMPALDLIAKYGAEPRVLLYVDPPYLGSTRCRSWDGYEHEMRSEADHRALAEALHAARAAVVLSGYPSDLYDRELYAGWDRHTMAASTGQGDAWANRTEVLWSNRPLATTATLFDLAEEAI